MVKFVDLPPEIIENIFVWLVDIMDVVELSLTCHQLYTISKSNRIWDHLSRYHYGCNVTLHQSSRKVFINLLHRYRYILNQILYEESEAGDPGHHYHRNFREVMVGDYGEGGGGDGCVVTVRYDEQLNEVVFMRVTTKGTFGMRSRDTATWFGVTLSGHIKAYMPQRRVISIQQRCSSSSAVNGGGHEGVKVCYYDDGTYDTVTVILKPGAPLRYNTAAIGNISSGFFVSDNPEFRLSSFYVTNSVEVNVDHFGSYEKLFIGSFTDAIKLELENGVITMHRSCIENCLEFKLNSRFKDKEFNLGDRFLWYPNDYQPSTYQVMIEGRGYVGGGNSETSVRSILILFNSDYLGILHGNKIYTCNRLSVI